MPSLATVHDLEQTRRVPPAPAHSRIRRQTLVDVPTRRLRWLSKALGLPSHGVAIVAGRGGSAKSTLALSWAARTTLGTFDGDNPSLSRDVCIIAHEDPFDSIVVPRLIAAGADLAKVHRLTIADEASGVSTVPRIPRDLAHVRAELADTNSKVLIIDPVTSVLEGDNDRLGDVRALVDALASVAEDLDVLVLLIVHFSKTKGARSGDRMSGSHAWRDAARVVFEVARDAESGLVIVTREKGNYARSSGDSFAFRLESVDIPTDDGESAAVARIVWLGRSVRTVDDVETASASTSRYGGLRSAILDVIAAASEPIALVKIASAFPDEPSTRIRQALTRLVESGDIERVDRGVYRALRRASEVPR